MKYKWCFCNWPSRMKVKFPPFHPQNPMIWFTFLGAKHIYLHDWKICDVCIYYWEGLCVFIWPLKTHQTKCSTNSGYWRTWPYEEVALMEEKPRVRNFPHQSTKWTLCVKLLKVVLTNSFSEIFALGLVILFWWDNMYTVSKQSL